MLRSVLVFAISAMFLGLGLGRFAFSPMIPELVEARWLDVEAAQTLGAANLVGYLAGALLAKSALKLTNERTLCVMSGAMVFLSYVLFTLPFGVGWFWFMRFLAGVGGALLMVVATAAAGRQLAAINRTSYQPLVFVGIGLGALFAAICLPQVLSYGIGVSVAMLMMFSGIALAALWWSSDFLRHDVVPQMPPKAPATRAGWGVSFILFAYGCDAFGFVMHTVYMPDMLRRTFGYTEGQVGLSWAMFGIGACLGPVFVLLLRRIFSVSKALWIALALKATSVALALLASNPLAAGLSLCMVGMLTPGIVILTSGALAAAAPPDRYLTLWAGGTALFALCQMVSGMFIAATSAQGYQTALILSVVVLGAGAALAFTSERMLAKARSRS